MIRRLEFLNVLLPVLACSFFPLACQQVVTIDLNKANPQIVIEGNITDQPGPYTVHITKTGDYFTPSLYFPPVSGATVIVQDDAGVIDTLRQTDTSTYVSSKIAGTAGRVYSLHVVAEGKTYDAVSNMPQKVTIDTIYSVQRTGFGGETGYNIYVSFKDPVAPGNYYRLNVNATGVLNPDSIDGRRYRLYDDKLTNGNEMSEQIRAGRNVVVGDTVTVELYTIDKTTYDYYNTLNSILRSDQSPTSLSPANPVTNLSNGSLGYFAAYTIDRRMIVIR